MKRREFLGTVAAGMAVAGFFSRLTRGKSQKPPTDREICQKLREAAFEIEGWLARNEIGIRHPAHTGMPLATVIGKALSKRLPITHTTCDFSWVDRTGKGLLRVPVHLPWKLDFDYLLDWSVKDFRAVGGYRILASATPERVAEMEAKYAAAHSDRNPKM